MKLFKITYTITLKNKDVSEAAAEEAIAYINNVLDIQVDPLLRRTVSNLAEQFGEAFKGATLTED